MKPGDRVRYVGPTAEAKGKLGTFVCDTGDGHARVNWDQGTYPDTPYLTSLELITVIDTIDTTKPLFVENGRRPVTFITLTSENHIMVGVQAKDNFLDDGWIIFDQSGKYVRSSNSMGLALRLANEVPKPVVKEVYVAVRDGRPTYHQYPPAGTSVAEIKLTITDGIVTAAELAEPNKDAFRTLPGGYGMNSPIQLRS